MIHHSWIELSSRGGEIPLIVDVTADQFGEGLPSVFVSRDSSWHRQFVGSRATPAESPRSWAPHAEAHVIEYGRLTAVPSLRALAAHRGVGIRRRRLTRG